MFDIRLEKHTDENPSEHLLGQVRLGDYEESFVASTTQQNASAYLHQWISALDTALDDRVFSALFSNVELDEIGVGRLNYYGLSPAENEQVNPEDGIYVTEGFCAVTTNPQAFTMDCVFEPGSLASHLGLYFLDPSNPSRIYPCLDTPVMSASFWHYSNSDFRACRDRLTARLHDMLDKP